MNFPHFLLILGFFQIPNLNKPTPGEGKTALGLDTTIHFPLNLNGNNLIPIHRNQCISILYKHFHYKVKIDTIISLKIKGRQNSGVFISFWSEEDGLNGHHVQAQCVLMFLLKNQHFIIKESLWPTNYLVTGSYYTNKSTILIGKFFDPEKETYSGRFKIYLN